MGCGCGGGGFRAGGVGTPRRSVATPVQMQQMRSSVAYAQPSRSPGSGPPATAPAHIVQSQALAARSRAVRRQV